MKDLFRQEPCPHCEYTKDGKALGCLNCHQTGKVYVPVKLLAEFKVKGSADCFNVHRELVNLVISPESLIMGWKFTVLILGGK